MVKRAFYLAAALLLSFMPHTAAAREKSVDVPIIMYHSICNTNNNAYVLKPSALESDFKYLKEKGYTPVTMTELIAFGEGAGDLPEKPVVITLDDGFYNNYHYVLPLLKKYGFKAVVSLVGSYCEKEASEKKRSPVYSYLNYAEIKDMAASGLVEFQNHSYDMHHNKGARVGVRRCSGETAQHYSDTLTADVKKCESLFQKHCGLQFNTFTYPFGYFSKDTEKILKGLGYRALLTCNEGVNRIAKGEKDKLYSLKRTNRPSKYTTAYFMEKLMKIC